MPWIIPVIFFLILLYLLWWFQSARQKETENGSSDKIQKALEIFKNSLFKRRRMFPGMVFSGTLSGSKDADNVWPARTPVEQKDDQSELTETLPQNQTVPADETAHENVQPEVSETPAAKSEDEYDDHHSNS